MLSLVDVVCTSDRRESCPKQKSHTENRSQTQLLEEATRDFSAMGMTGLYFCKHMTWGGKPTFLGVSVSRFTKKRRQKSWLQLPVCKKRAYHTPRSLSVFATRPRSSIEDPGKRNTLAASE